LTFLGVFLLILVHRRSMLQTLWILLPLVAGIALTLGVMGILGLKLNFFNVVVIPTLLGVGVDHGVHYYRRWHELQSDVEAAQRELLGPLTVCSATTMMGYVGMVFSSHRGLQSIGLVACLGLGCIWITSLILLPGILEWSRLRR
jgi:predicted RND superfamily exporter protein